MTKIETKIFKFVRKSGLQWSAKTAGETNAWVKGCAFRDNVIYRERNLASLFIDILEHCSESDRDKQFYRILEQLNGNFAIVLDGKGWAFAAVDRVRSIPLFYGIKDSKFVLSDDANSIKEQFTDENLDPMSVKEFMLTGYVTGSDTVYKNIKQLQAGEYLSYSAKEGSQSVMTERYYRFLHSEPTESVSEEFLLANLKTVCEGSVQRFIDYADGKQIVVPLSAGLDSRLIVTMLHRAGYENVLTFSYGAPGNKEAQTSQMVAELLSFNWTFVEYSSTLWYQWWRTTERLAYQRYASNHASLPNIQDWPAVWTLRNREVIKNDAVFAPGHTGDFISGGHIPVFGADVEFSAHLPLRTIWERHYSLFRTDYSFYENYFTDKTMSILDKLPCGSIEALANVYEYWEWQERQAKFIVNAVRTYEFWDYDWWLPLWDAEFMDFWERVPLQFRVNKGLYDRFVSEIFRDTTGISTLDTVRKSNKSFLRNYITAISPTPFNKSAKVLYYLCKRLLDYELHPLAWYGIFSFPAYLKLILQQDVLTAPGFCINSLVVKEFIRDLNNW